MTSDITTSTTPTLTLEQCDEAATQGILLLSDAVLNYAKHGLTSKAIGERVRGLGQSIGDSTVRRWISGFKADKLLPEKEKTQAAEKQQRYRDRVTNAQNEQTLPAQPQPEPEIIEAEVKELGAWAYEPLRTAEEVKASYSKAINDKLDEHIETIFLVLDEAKGCECVLSARNRKLLTLLSKSIQHYDQIIDHPSDA